MGCSSGHQQVDLTAQKPTGPKTEGSQQPSTEYAWQGFTSPVPRQEDGDGIVEIGAHNTAAPTKKKGGGILKGWTPNFFGFGSSSKKKTNKKKNAQTNEAPTEPSPEQKLEALKQKAHQTLLQAAGNGQLEGLLGGRAKPFQKKPSVGTWLAYAP
mmetsp:Transcript_33988/g.60117  ORF Transcript_33988/g.60117 Transcript_33988/m.60117 type:complete len:155 (-) Transcript_33988:270-734(-)